MKEKQPKKRAWVRQARQNFAILLLLAIMGGADFFVVRNELLANAQDMGVALARNYSEGEQSHIAVYSALMEVGTGYLEQQALQGADEQALQTWVKDFFGRISGVVEQEALDTYALIDGKIISANPWQGSDTYDYTQTEWYQKAMRARGEVVFTNAYIDAVTGAQVITIAQKAHNSDNMLMFDVAPRRFHQEQNPIRLLEGSSFYLCDQAGTLLLAQSAHRVPEQAMQTLAHELMDRMAAGALDAYTAGIEDTDGTDCGIYYYEMSNGWVAFLAVPFETILGDLNGVFVVFAAAYALLFGLVVFVFVRDRRMEMRVQRVHDTVHMLGNAYYSIYRINYQKGTYETIKSASDVAQTLGKGGAYEYLLQVLKARMEPGLWQEFDTSFSLESIRRLVQERVREFGGDYLRHFAGSDRWVNISLLFDEDLTPGEVIFAFREVDQEKRAQLEQFVLLQNTLESERRSEKEKSQFFSNVSHDLRTPLGAILGFAELAQKNLDDPDKLEPYLRKIDRSGRQMLELVNDVLELSRLEHGKVSLTYQPIDLQACVQECAELFLDQAAEEKKDFRAEYSVRDPQVLGDAVRIRQILNNLLSNAFKYSGEGAKIRLCLRQCEQQKYAKYQIVVKDTGAGMSEEFLSQLFVPYSRETRFGARAVSGTGLGMPIVQSLVKRMGGDIAVESALGQGTTVTVTLPMQTVETGQPPTAASASAAGHLEGKRLLLAEDNPMNMEIATEILSMHGLKITQAWDGAAAVEAFRASEVYAFDAVLMDMQMPVLDGCEAARQIRAMDRPDAKTVPILAVTANAFAEDVARTTQAGMDAHIPKPIDYSILCETLDRLRLGRRQAP